MSDVRSAHRRVREHAAEAAGLRADIAAADARLTRLRRARDAAARRADPRLIRPPRPLADLGDDLAAAELALAQLREKLRQAERRLAEELRGLAGLSDPRDDIAHLDGGTPLLLMPLRIETRFIGAELWVRIYPDQWAVDGFEERLSDTEVVNATRFWASYFRAGGDEGMRRAAWRTLVTSGGSGRAGWIVGRFAPLNLSEEPVRTSPDEVILVVAGDLTLTSQERGAARAYWEKVWRANGDPDGVFAAELRGEVGDARAKVLLGAPPHAFDERPGDVDPEQVNVTIGFCELPSLTDDDTKPSAWTQAARAGLLPDQIMLIGRESGRTVLEFAGKPIPPTLAVGPDPAAGPGDQFRIENGELVVPDDLRWMVDFDAAVEVGMAMRVPLGPGLDRGFDRLFAVGIRAGATPGEDQADLEELLTHHHRARSGMSILAQGTPTNNTEGVPSGFSRLDDPELSFHRYLGTGSPLVDEPRWAVKQDGQWLAECLGVAPEVFGAVAGATDADQAEAFAMNTALWPATWGYFLESMMHPLLGDDEVQRTRNFFLGYVSGRGRVPALRLGRQPYGIVPATAYARLKFGTGGPGDPADPGDLPMLNVLGELLAVVTADLAKLTDAVPHAYAASGDPHQTLLDIVALHPASVEFHQRYAESINDLFNRFRFDNLGQDFFNTWTALGHLVTGRRLLASLGYRGNATPDVLGKLLHTAQHRLKGPIVDDRPLSEEAAVRPYCDDGRNYLQWLADAARSSLEEVRQEIGFTGDREPNALLYILLRHAVLLSWWDAAVRLRLEFGLITPAELLAARREPPFVHVAAGQTTESRWNALYGAAPAITGDPFRALHEIIPELLDKPAADHLRELVAAIKALAGLPTARLERLLAEHLDCASHRVDAWRLGLVTRRLLDMRGLAPGDGLGGASPQPRRGIHVGAYGWLHDVRPESRELEPVELPDELKPAFENGPAPVRDSANGGFVHAPSLNHAATAAILRSGFLGNATPDHPDTMALNLSSGRMRLATSVLQGLREGQPLGALLGYRFERGLHDRHGLAEVDAFIHPLRLAFPLAGDRDGRMCVDGLELIRHVREAGAPSYPFGRTDLPAASAAQRQAIDLEVERLLDVHDAIGDLILAESVHQAVLGNADRTASSLDSVGRGGFPPEPAILETPGRTHTLTHRVAVHLRAGLDHRASPVSGIAMTPRAMAEPGVNELAAAMLPPPADVVVRVRWNDQNMLVSQADLGLQPIDLLYLVRLESQAALGELDERILRHVAVTAGLRPDAAPVVHLTERVPGKTTFFEIAPLVGQLRAMATTSRPLRATDMLRAGEARATADALVHADRDRVAAVATELDGHLSELATLRTRLDAVEGPEALDLLVGQAGAVLVESGRFGLPSGGAGRLAATRAVLFGDLLQAVAALTGRWRARLDRADAALAYDSALPSTATDPERVAVLLRADRELHATPTRPVPTDAEAFRAAIETARSSFAARLAGFEAVAEAATGVADALSRVAVLLPVDAFDAEPFPVGGFTERAIALCGDASQALGFMIAEVQARSDAAAGHLAAHDSATAGRPKAEALTAAVTALLGPDAVFVPEFDLPEELAGEWEAALQWSRSGGLLAGLASRPFPVDDWLHGAARVRGPMRAWEETTLLAGAFGRPEPELTPVQFPHAAEPWLALEWPPGTDVAGDRLLYTAHYPAAFDRKAPQAGLLLDEWVEVVPDDMATTGIVFHHDSPDSEPPQAMLLVVPPDASSGWRWDDLVDALDDTFDLARQRALEPEAIAQTAYASFLPATLTEATVRGLGISANLAVNNGLYGIMRADHA
ncbi:hypothetical protein Acor_19480 [Acrocarpospora corrugata]|uniref:Uncharacterized protein n=1 Tax=Acrocarpospora corrugata TaxID=35763 RepID=A0A5M3VSY8_9ACTN|nr:hypothetical protein [Acrocarpospora corrugata]GER99884.1 hypothetical protein Acor_19480 [Acrocarpospora corrugata]